MKNTHQKGFTLLELLVVIAIIGLLASAVLALTGSARERTRDARRLEDLREIEKALNLYFASNNTFPVETTTLTGSDPVSTALTGANLIPAIPQDPQSPTYTYGYESITGSGYTLSFCLETDTISNFAQGCGNTIAQ